MYFKYSISITCISITQTLYYDNNYLPDIWYLVYISSFFPLALAPPHPILNVSGVLQFSTPMYSLINMGCFIIESPRLTCNVTSVPPLPENISIVQLNWNY